MNTRRALAFFAVACMLVASLAAVGCSESSGDVTKITSDDTVTIRADKNYEYNAEELKKLGITDSSSWKYNRELGCNQLTIENLDFRTTAGTALHIGADGSDEVSFALKIVGDNVIRSGSEEGNSIAIDADMYGSGKPVNLTIFGDGKLSVGNDVNDKKTTFAAGIYVTGTLSVRQTEIVAEGGSFVNDDIQSEHVISEGICAQALDVYSDPEGPVTKITAVGGNVTAEFDDEAAYDSIDIYSFGISCPSYHISNSIIIAMAGNANYTETTPGLISEYKFMATSLGLNGTIAMPESSFAAVFENSYVYATSGDAVGQNRATSKGATLQSAGSIEINDCIFVTSSSSATVRESEIPKTLATAYGMEFYSVAKVHDSLVCGMGGTVAGAKFNFSLGIHGKMDMFYYDSIINTKSDGTGLCTIKKMGTKDFNYLYLENTDVFSYGKTRAVNGDPNKVSVKNDDWVYFRSIDQDGNRKPITKIGDIITAGNCVELAYHYDVVFLSEDLLPIAYVMLDVPYTELPEYIGEIPEGKSFTWLANGEVKNAGDFVFIDDPLFLMANFEEKPEAENQSTVIVCAAAGVLSAGILIAFAVKP